MIPAKIERMVRLLLVEWLAASLRGHTPLPPSGRLTGGLRMMTSREVGTTGRSNLTASESRRDRRRLFQTRHGLHEVALDLIRSVFPPKGVRLVGVTLSNFQSQSASEAAELPFS
jgi:hypothetical protein